MFESIPDDQILTMVGEDHRSGSVLMARKLAGIAQILTRRVEEQMQIDLDVRSMITGFAQAAAEVAVAMNLTTKAARQMVFDAEALDQRLPAVGALLADGAVDWAVVELVIRRTELVDCDDVMVRLDAALAERIARWSSWSRKKVIDAVDHEVALLDRDAVKKRRVRAYDERRVEVSKDRDGMARVRASLPGTAGAAVEKVLSQMARQVCPGDPRTLQQRRADAFVALTLRQNLACQCADVRCPSRPAPESVPEREASDYVADTPPTPAASKTAAQCSCPSLNPKISLVLNMFATAETVNGTSQAPGYLAGFGIIDAELVRELARDATRRLVEEPCASAADALRYRPSAALARWIRFRDLTCRFPGCTVPAESCDVDHTIPFNHNDPAAGGQTVASNLACYCRTHHRLKTFGGWRDEQLQDGTIVWTSPAGQTERTVPGAAELFGGLSRPRRPEDLKRIGATRDRISAHRDASAYHEYRNRAARDELRHRDTRNGIRLRYVLFRGHTALEKPSTSPFCRWVNDPLEPDSLPPDWEPPRHTPSDPDEPPPF